MLRIKSFVAILAFSTSASFTAEAQTFKMTVNAERPLGAKIAEGIIYMGPAGARAYDGPPHQYFGAASDADGATGATTVSEAAVEGVGPAADQSIVTHLNDMEEVLYDYESQVRVEFDHIAKLKRTARLKEAQKTPGTDIIAGGPDGANPGQASALGALFQQFTQARVDPKSEVKLIRTGDAEEIELKNALIRLEKQIASKMGGPYAEIWTADAPLVEGGDELLEALKLVPLEASNRQNDVLGLMRQIAEATGGELAFRIDMYGPEANDGTRQVDYRLEVADFEMGDEFTVVLNANVGPKDLSTYREFSESSP